MSLRQIELPGLPERPLRPRSDGLTLALDKGLSARQAEDFMDVASEFVDFVKLGWGTAVITPNLRRKLDVYREAGTAVYLGGTLFEAYYMRRLLSRFISLVDPLGLSLAADSYSTLHITQ